MLILAIIGPWFVGELMAGHIGAMFVYGLYVDGHFIPGTLTFFYGYWQVM